ncbi:MAG: alanyl-tRNA editing protein [Nanoarchaeota archaeon]|nr:alanyl-tRNA editing protein [Nanoarchaeota archaeon]
MAEALYLDDSYLKEFEAKVVSIKDNKFVLLDKTAFYPQSGGQPYDTGVLIRKSDNKEFKVVYVGKFSGEISHEVSEPGLEEEDEVIGKIDWERRYKHMRAHTSAHILAESLYRNSGALTTGNQLGDEKCRLDSNFEYSPELIEKTFKEANEIIEKDLPVSVEYLSREDAEKIPNFTKLAKGLPAEIKTVRIVNIGDYDKQADGGTHVKTTKEVGKIEFLEYNSKGKNNKRIYFRLI